MNVFDSFYYTIPKIDSIGNPTAETDTIVRSRSKMTDRDFIITTSGGSFTTSNMKTEIVAFPKHAATGVPNPRYQHMRYAKNIGIITETEPFF